MRQAAITRNTTETRITLSLALEGRGEGTISTGCGFLDHMLTLFARHGRFDLTVDCKGDSQVDFHHTTEDVAIVLGEAFAKALGEKRGICRYGSCTLPMDEALILTAVDLSGRTMVTAKLDIPAQKVGDFDTELAEEFLLGLARGGQMTIHAHQLAGSNSHHIIEGLFKSLGRSLRQAAALDPELGDEIPSTKGVL